MHGLALRCWSIDGRSLRLLLLAHAAPRRCILSQELGLAYEVTAPEITEAQGHDMLLLTLFLFQVWLSTSGACWAQPKCRGPRASIWQ